MPDGPLRGTSVALPPAGAAADCARVLLRCLGADTGTADHEDGADGADDLGLAGHDAVTDWAASGAMALTGYADGPPSLIHAAPASLVRAALALIGPKSSDARVQLLGERAAAAGLQRRAPWSPGGAFRAIRTRDGWLGISLARDSDVELVPALIGAPVDDPWTALAQWAEGETSAAVEQRAILLGLPAARIPATPAMSRAPLVASRGGPRRSRAAIVLDLSSLWAGPLCAHLLSQRGARVIKVESSSRPDGARRGPAAFFDLLHAGHESVVLDFATPAGRDALRRLVGAADLVIEASRPRALMQLGLLAEDVVAQGTSWLSISGYGRDEPGASRVGFGDDVAAAAGLVCWQDGLPLPVGDAIADPLAGVVAAAAAHAALGSPDAWLLDVSMRDVAGLAATTKPEPGNWTVVSTQTGWTLSDADRVIPVAEPTMSGAAPSARPAGADTDAVLAEFGR